VTVVKLKNSRLIVQGVPMRKPPRSPLIVFTEQRLQAVNLLTTTMKCCSMFVVENLLWNSPLTILSLVTNTTSQSVCG